MAGYFIGVYWGPRKEPRLACAARLSTFLTALTTNEYGFIRWMRKGKVQGGQAVQTTEATIAKLLRTNNRDVGGEAIAELGFSFSVWSQSNSGIVVSLSATCGAFSPRISNSLVVSFDPSADPTMDLLREIFTKAVETFDPELGVVSTMDALATVTPEPAWNAPSLFRYARSDGFSGTGDGAVATGS